MIICMQSYCGDLVNPAVGRTIEEAYNNWVDSNGDPCDFSDLVFYEAEEIKVTKETKFVVAEKIVLNTAAKKTTRRGRS